MYDRTDGFDHTDEADWPSTDPHVLPSSSRGRHRTPRRFPRRLALAAGGTALVGLVGLGATQLPANFAGTSTSSAPADSATLPGGTGGSETTIDADLVSPTAATPSGSSAASPAPPTGSPTSAAPSASPSRKATPATTAPKQTPSRTPAQVSAGDSREEQVLAIVNQERSANGCGAVKINAKLATSARQHSADQAANDKMSHTGSDGSSFVQRAQRAGYQNAIGENVAAGYRTPTAVMEGWMNSSGHRANILNCQAKAIGIGVVAAADGTLYWTQVFGSVA
ncbi:CAP domain-containing protein [Micromonospora sp. NPDC003197]